MNPSAEFLTLVGVSCVSVGIGSSLARQPRRKLALASLGFALVGWPVALNLWPYHLYFIYPAFPFGEALFGCTFVILGVLYRAYSDTSPRRILQGVLAAALAYFVLAEPGWFALYHEEVAALEGERRDGVVIQSTHYSCLPAALATVLGLWGLEVREGEVALFSRTTFQGTRPTRVPGAVRVLGSAEGLSARVLETTLDALAAADRPAVLLGYSGPIPHAFALLSLDDAKAMVGDPLRGRFSVDRSRLTERLHWTGRAIVVMDDGRRADPPRLRPDAD